MKVLCIHGWNDGGEPTSAGFLVGNVYDCDYEPWRNYIQVSDHVQIFSQRFYLDDFWKHFTPKDPRDIVLYRIKREELKKAML